MIYIGVVFVPVCLLIKDIKTIRLSYGESYWIEFFSSLIIWPKVKKIMILYLERKESSMKKCLLCLIVLLICIVLSSSSIADGFTKDGDAIEKAAKSVLMLGAFNDNEPDTYYTGSGFVAFNNSTLITNYHVIEGATEIYAADDDDNIYELKYVLCADKDYDIAILGFSESTNLEPLDLYPDDQIKRGSPVIVIGSPYGGNKNTVSDGVVSSQLIREDERPEIQFTASISHGNSGGPVLNDDGKVIGVATETFTEGQNLNFAVNISVAQAMYNAWDGKKYSLHDYKNIAKMDFSGVYQHNQSDNTSKSSNSWTCIKCGSENTTRFCQTCGAEKPYWVCSCGKMNGDNQFCGDCGNNCNELIKEFNNAMSEMSQGNYWETAGKLAELGSFSSGTFETVKGKETNASSYMDTIAEHLSENGKKESGMIVSQEEVTICSACGKIYPIDTTANYCGDCGGELTREYRAGTIHGVVLDNENIKQYFDFNLSKTDYNRTKGITITYTIKPTSLSFADNEMSSDDIMLMLRVSVYLTTKSEDPCQTKYVYIRLRRTEGYRDSQDFFVPLNLEQDYNHWIYNIVACDGQIGVEDDIIEDQTPPKVIDSPDNADTGLDTVLTPIPTPKQTPTSTQKQTGETPILSGDVIGHKEYMETNNNALVTIEAYIQAYQVWHDGLISLYLQDNRSGAYFVKDMSCTEDEAQQLMSPGTKLRITGIKTEWSGEIEIINATYEIIKGYYVANYKDITALLGKDDLLINHMNEKVAFRGLKVVPSKIGDQEESAFRYAWDGSGNSEDNCDLFFNVEHNGQIYEFWVNSLLTGNDTDVYRTVEQLKIGDIIDCEGYLYWYDGANPHITAVIVR